MRSSDLTFQAARLQTLIHEHGDYAHVSVHPRAGHLNIEVEQAGERWIVARATPIGGNEYGLSFRTHSGRWEPMLVSGPMEAIVDGLIGCLGSYLSPTELR